MRQAGQTDAPELAQLLRATGLDDNPDPARIARVVLESHHVTLVQEEDKRFVGFVSAFLTTSFDKKPRWEVDLLGVHPDYRGRGIAQALVRAVVEAGRVARAQSSGALVKIDNTASLNTFRRCGFTPDETICDLWVSDQSVDDDITAPPNIHLIPVETLTYSGLWIEGDLSLPALRWGLAERTRIGLDIAGAVIPTRTLAAEQVGYEAVGQYRWLRLEGTLGK